MKKFIFFLIILSGTAFSHVTVAETGNEMDFLGLKEQGRYVEALDCLARWSETCSEPGTLEVNIFRVRDLMVYPELYEKGLETLEKMGGNPLAATDPVVKARLCQCSADLLLRRGDISGAGTVLKNLDYKEFMVLGPFDNTGMTDFDNALIPDMTADRSRGYRGKTHKVSWFKAVPNRAGVIDMNELLPDVGESLFYFYTTLQVPENGVYSLILGKCGYTDLFLDGSLVFRNRVRHGFCNDQYAVQISLERGPHRVLLKCGDTGGKLSLSLRLDRGMPVLNAGEENDAVSTPARSSGNGQYFSHLGMKESGASDASLFRRGFLLYMLGLNSLEEREVFEALHKVGPESEYYSWARYYAGMAEEPDRQKELYFQDAVRSRRSNIEAAVELALLKIRRGLFYEVEGLVKHVKEAAGVSPWYLMLMAEYAAGRGWNDEAQAMTARLKRTSFPSLAHSVDFVINKNKMFYDEAVKNLSCLHDSDRYEEEYAELLVRYCRRAGNEAAALEVLNRAAAMHPRSVRFKLMYADMMHDRGDSRGALPYLAAARSISPCHKETLFALARAYMHMGHSDAARHYLRLLVEIDPDNISVKEYLHFITEEDDGLMQYRCQDDVTQLAVRADAFRNEQAVVLLDEEAIDINTSGSYTRHRRKVVLINSEAAIDDFNKQYVVFSPETEDIEKVSCRLINDGTATEITERYLQSLSDPDARLYYDVKALIIPVLSLRKGAILDIHYTVINRAGRELRSYFGHRSVIGNSYRTLVFNRILRYPQGKKVYSHLRGIEKGSLKRYHLKNREIAHLRKENIGPYKRETAMPDEDGLLPSLCFTSFRSWQDAYEWYRPLMKDRIVLNDAMKKTVKEIVRSKRGDLEKISAIYDHVASTIRYVGFELGMGGLQPRRADMVYSSKMGDCKDMSLVLVAMLREAGFNAQLALVRTRDRGPMDGTVPFLGYFNHAVCYVDVGRAIFLDATSKYSGFMELPRDDRGVSAMLIGEKNVRFINTADSLYHEDLVEVSNTVMINGEGKAEIERYLKKTGASAPAMRHGLESAEKKYNSLMVYWNSKFTGARVSGLEIINTERDEPVECSYRVSAPSLCQVAGDDLIFRSFLVPSNYLQACALTKERTFPMLLPSSGKTVVTMEYRIPKGYRIFFCPRSESFADKDFSATIRYEKKNNAIVIRSVTEINRSFVTPEQYTRYRDFARFVNRKERERIILTKRRTPGR